jgi:hypothetical protein
VRAGGTARPGGPRQRAKHAAAPTRPSWLPTVLVVLLLLTGTAAALRLAGLPGEGRRSSSLDTATTGAAEEGSRIVVRIAGDGVLRVEQDVTLHGAVRELQLAVPQRRGVTATLQPVLDEVTVETGGQEVPVGSTLHRGDRTTVPLPGRTTQAVVRYAATGVVLRSEPSTAGRALALATPLVIAQATGLPSQVDIESVMALNVGCVDLVGTMTGCGSRTSSGWTVETSPAEPYADVVVQLDLAAP